MHCSLVPVPFDVESPCLAWRFITNCYVFDCCVYLSEWVKVTVVLRSHLTQTEMTTVFRNVRPTRFLCDDLIEALEFFIVQNP